MAKLSNIQEAKEFVQANKQALSEMGFSAKEVEKVFAAINRDLDKQRGLTQEALRIYKEATEEVAKRIIKEKELKQAQDKKNKQEKKTYKTR